MIEKISSLLFLVVFAIISDFYNISAFNKAIKENLPIMAIDGWENVHPLLKIIPSSENIRSRLGSCIRSRHPNK